MLCACCVHVVCMLCACSVHVVCMLCACCVHVYMQLMLAGVPLINAQVRSDQFTIELEVCNASALVGTCYGGV